MATVRGVRKRTLRARSHVLPIKKLPLGAGEGTVKVDLRDPGGLHLATWGPGSVQPLAIRCWRHLLELSEWDLVIDAGASYGEFAVPAARRFGSRVVAVEPNPRVSPLLAESLHAVAPRAKVVTSFLGRESSIAPLRIDGNSRTTSMSTTAGRRRSLEVPVLSLDAVVSAIVDELPWNPSLLIKIDVEGAELEVLRGAPDLLTTERAVLMCEALHTGVSALVDALPGFDCYALAQGSGLPVPLARVDNRASTRDVVFARGVDVTRRREVSPPR